MFRHYYVILKEQGTKYELSEDDTKMSKHLGL